MEYPWALPRPAVIAKCGFKDFPAPEYPTARFATISEVSINPCATAGSSAKVTAVTLQPGTAISRALAKAWRCRRAGVASPRCHSSGIA